MTLQDTSWTVEIANESCGLNKDDVLIFGAEGTGIGVYRISSSPPDFSWGTDCTYEGMSTAYVSYSSQEYVITHENGALVCTPCVHIPDPPASWTAQAGGG